MYFLCKYSLNTSGAKCKPNWNLKRFTFKVMFLVGVALFTVSLQLGDELASACRQIFHFHSNYKCNNMLATKAITKWSLRDILGVHISGCKPVSRPVSLRLYSLELSSSPWVNITWLVVTCLKWLSTAVYQFTLQERHQRFKFESVSSYLTFVIVWAFHWSTLEATWQTLKMAKNNNRQSPKHKFVPPNSRYVQIQVQKSPQTFPNTVFFCSSTVSSA